jgi:hypothetical protein
MQQRARKMLVLKPRKPHDIFQPHGIQPYRILARALRPSILRTPDRRVHEIVTALLQAYGIVQP